MPDKPRGHEWLIAGKQLVRHSRDDLWAYTDGLIPYEIFSDYGLIKFIKKILFMKMKKGSTGQTS